MKKIFPLIAFLGLIFLSQLVQAQPVSVGLGLVRSEHFGDVFKFPIGLPSRVATNWGAKLNFNYGWGEWDRNRISFGYTFYIPTDKIDFHYYGITANRMFMEWDVYYARYILKRSRYPEGGIYIFGGGSVTYHNLDYTVPDPTVSEANLFSDENIIGTHANGGIGAELPTGDAGFAFIETKLSWHTNAYINNTTVKETQFISFWTVTLGWRFPVGSNKSVVRHSR